MTQGTMDGEATDGKAAIPAKAPTVDGVIDNTPAFNEDGQEFKTLSFGGTTWINNLNAVAVGSPPDTNQYAPFPWQFPNIAIQQEHAISMFSEFLYWKPESVTVEFMNAQNYTQINTGTTPFMMPSSNGKLIAVLDREEWTVLDSNPFLQQVAPAVYTQSYIRGLIQSWQQAGYNNDLQGFLPQLELLALGAIKQPNVTDPSFKAIRMGQGHSMTFTHKFHNRYWRSTAEFLYDPTSTTGNPAVIYAPRADELQGFIQPRTGPGTAAAFDPFPLITGTFPYGNQTSSDQITTQPSNNNFSAIPATDANPQPNLFLHLVPDIGVLGTAGTSNCQFDFKVSWTFRLKGRPLPRPRIAYGPITGLTIQHPAQSVFVPMMFAHS